MTPVQRDEQLVRRHLAALDGALAQVRRHAGRPLAALKNCPKIGQFFSSRAKGSTAGGVKSANLLRGRGEGSGPPFKNLQDGSIYGHVLSADLDERWAVERGLQVCAQNCIDIATHLATSAGHSLTDYASASPN